MGLAHRGQERNYDCFIGAGILESRLFELFLFHGALELRMLAAVCIRKCIFGWQDLPILFREGLLAPMKREGNCPIVHFRVSFAGIALGQAGGT